MLPQRNVVGLARKSSRRRSATAEGGGGGGGGGSGGGVGGSGSGNGNSAGGRRTMIKITRNPFFNYRTLVRHRLQTAAAASLNAIVVSTVAGREWSALDEQQKRPYRRLAHLSQMNGGPFFVQLEHLRTFVRYPECVHNNEYWARVRASTSARASAATAGGSGHKVARPRPPRTTDESPQAAQSVGVSPQPDANFGGYDVATKGLKSDVGDRCS